MTYLGVSDESKSSETLLSVYKELRSSIQHSMKEELKQGCHVGRDPCCHCCLWLNLSYILFLFILSKCLILVKIHYGYRFVCKDHESVPYLYWLYVYILYSCREVRANPSWAQERGDSTQKSFHKEKLHDQGFTINPI